MKSQQGECFIRRVDTVNISWAIRLNQIELLNPACITPHSVSCRLDFSFISHERCKPGVLQRGGDMNRIMDILRYSDLQKNAIKDLDLISNSRPDHDMKSQLNTLCWNFDTTGFTA